MKMPAQYAWLLLFLAVLSSICAEGRDNAERAQINHQDRIKVVEGVGMTTDAMKVEAEDDLKMKLKVIGTKRIMSRSHLLVMKHRRHAKQRAETGKEGGHTDSSQDTCSINVRKYLDKRFGPDCKYTLRKGHPNEIVVGDRSLCDPENEDEIVVPVHIFSGRVWFQDATYPTAKMCHSPPRSVFLQSVSPETCLEHVDFEWLECDEQRLPPHGQTILSFCHETPFTNMEPTENTLDAGSGPCSVIPTSWTPRLSYLTGLDLVPLEKKKKHPLITSMISHAFSTMRRAVTEALIRRNVSFHRFGHKMRSTTAEAYLESFNSKPRVRDPDQNENYNIKLNAIRWSKFHLAMEHSSMYGYTSEKVWQALRAGTVPVYHGGRDARFLLPPKSTVWLGDYETLDGMIDHLEYLDGNDTAYNEYLDWRKDAKDPTHPWTEFMEHNGFGIRMNTERLCVANDIGADVLREYREFGRVEPFERHWTDWTTGTKCYIPDGGCDGRKDIREEPKFVCDGPTPDLSLYAVDQVLWDKGTEDKYSQAPMP